MAVGEEGYIDLFYAAFSEAPKNFLILRCCFNHLKSNSICQRFLYIGTDTVIEDIVFIHGKSDVGHNNSIGVHYYISGRFNSAAYRIIGKRNFIGVCVIMADHISITDYIWVGLRRIEAKDIERSEKYMSLAAKLYKIE